MNSRIKELRKAMRLTQIEFGSRIGVKGNTVTGYENGLRSPSDAVIMSICKEFNANEQWLRTGEGEMFNKMSRDEEVAKFFGEMLMPAGDEDSFKRRFISAVARLNPEQWKMLEEVATALTEGMKKADP